MRRCTPSWSLLSFYLFVLVLLLVLIKTNIKMNSKCDTVKGSILKELT